MATKQDNSKNISIRPRKGNESMKSKLKKLADKKRRSLNEYAERVIEVHIDNPKEIF